MLDEILRDIRATLYERVSNPLLSAFMISWSLWHYDIFLYVFSDLSPETKVKLIQKSLSKPFLGLSYLKSGAALVTAFSYLYAYPIIGDRVFEHWKKRQKKLNDMRRQIEGDELLTRGESLRLRTKHEQLRQEYASEIKERDAMIEALNEKINSPGRQLESPEAPIVTTSRDESIIEADAATEDAAAGESADDSIEAAPVGDMKHDEINDETAIKEIVEYLLKQNDQQQQEVHDVMQLVGNSQSWDIDRLWQEREKMRNLAGMNRPRFFGIIEELISLGAIRKDEDHEGSYIIMNPSGYRAYKSFTDYSMDPF